MNTLPAINARVRLTGEAIGKLDSSRAGRSRDPAIAGTVTEYVTGRGETKAVVVWDKPKGMSEQLLPKYLELVT